MVRTKDQKSPRVADSDHQLEPSRAVVRTGALNTCGEVIGRLSSPQYMLDKRESAPTGIFNPGGRSPFLLLGDHAGRTIPRSLGTLGLSQRDRRRHIAWDIGVRGLGQFLAAALDATFIYQTYSRLVVDCNRDPRSAKAILVMSDESRISGNEDIPDHHRIARINCIHSPYHDRIKAEIDGRTAAGRATVVIALHSFTPKLAGILRPWEIGVMYADGDIGFATAFLELLVKDTTIIAGDNQPYRLDETDYTIFRHAIANGLPYAELEIRQDLIEQPEGQHSWCERLAPALEAALSETRMGPSANNPV